MSIGKWSRTRKIVILLTTIAIVIGLVPRIRGAVFGDDASINTITITNVSEPTAGETFTTIVGGGGMEWAIDNGNASLASTPIIWWSPEPTTGVADYNTSYTAFVSMTASEGSAFSGSLSATIDGQPAEIVTMSDDKKVVTFSYTFDATDKNYVYTQEVYVNATNGTTMDHIGLPATVPVVTEDGSVLSANVTWDKDNVPYNPGNANGTVFDVVGEVDLSGLGVVNGDGLDLSQAAKAHVTVGAAELTSNLVDHLTLEVPRAIGGRNLTNNYSVLSAGIGNGTMTYTNGTNLGDVALYDTAYTAKMYLEVANGFKFADVGDLIPNIDITNGQLDAGSVTLNPERTQLTFNVVMTSDKATVLSATALSDLTFNNGISIDNLMAQLPSSDTIITQLSDQAVPTALTFNRDELAAAYDPEVTDEQTFVLMGALTMPAHVYDINGVGPLQQKVTVRGADVIEDVTLTLKNGAVTVTAPTVGSPLPSTVSATTLSGSLKDDRQVSWEGELGDGNLAQFGEVYTITVTLQPATGYVFKPENQMNVRFGAEPADTVVKNGDGTLTVTKAYTMPKAKLKSITDPSSVVENGAEKTVEGLGLPATVKVNTEVGTVREADVAWDLTGISYDPDKAAQQTFKVPGLVTLPDSIDANGHDLETEATVTVLRRVVVYDFTRGANQNWVMDDDNREDATFVCDGPEAELKTVYIDGINISNLMYDVDDTNGTTLTLKKAFLDQLAEQGTGPHTLRLTYQEGYADTAFNIRKKNGGTTTIVHDTTLYNITAGANQSLTQSDEADKMVLNLEGNGEKAKLRGIFVDGVAVAEDNFEVTGTDTTKVSFHGDYVKGLAKGAHSVRLQYEDGYANTAFAILAVPNTGADGNNGNNGQTNTGTKPSGSTTGGSQAGGTAGGSTAGGGNTAAGTTSAGGTRTYTSSNGNAVYDSNSLKGPYVQTGDTAQFGPTLAFMGSAILLLMAVLKLQKTQKKSRKKTNR